MILPRVTPGPLRRRLRRPERGLPCIGGSLADCSGNGEPAAPGSVVLARASLAIGGSAGTVFETGQLDKCG